MSKTHVMSVVGARPNLMKIAPLAHELAKQPDKFEHSLVHTGQHYDQAMSQSFFEALDIPMPDVNLNIGSGSHATQVGQTMIAFEEVVTTTPPDVVVVVGDVNATCACALVAAKQHIALAHIEAGLRSFDKHMPEEVNRMVTDRLADILFTPDHLADQNLLREGTAPDRICQVGNIMIDTLDAHRSQAARLNPIEIIGRHLITPGQPAWQKQAFALLTMHRPSNVDSPEVLLPLLELLLDQISPQLPIVWAMHPRTIKQLQLAQAWKRILAHPSVYAINPLGYHEMLCLNMNARLVLSDSGGLQEECCVLGTPCLTLRDNTERPITLQENGGVSILVGNDPSRIMEGFDSIKDKQRQPFRPPLWDGQTASRIAESLAEL